MTPFLNSLARWCAGAALLIAFPTFASAAEALSPYAGPFEIGKLSKKLIPEASGLAPSRRAPDMLWTHNDSGGAPVLFAVGASDAKVKGRIRLEGTLNQDWEDISSYLLDGKAWLLVADTGDNNARRSQVALHVLEEPNSDRLSRDAELLIAPAFSIYFAYEDGPRDCESVAVDPSERAVYLLSKREPMPKLYRLPLVAADRQHAVTARIVGKVPHLPKPDKWQKSLPIPTGAYRGAPTAMGFNSARTAALVLTYGELLLFPREKDQSWADALAKEPFYLPQHPLPQAEGACFSADDLHLFAVSEGMPLLVRYDRK